MNNLLARFIAIFILVSIIAPLVYYSVTLMVLIFVSFGVGCIAEYVLLCETYKTHGVIFPRFYTGVSTERLIVSKIIMISYPLLVFIDLKFSHRPDIILHFLIYSILILNLTSISNDLRIDLEEVVIGILWICTSVIISIIYDLKSPLLLTAIATISWFSDGISLLIGKAFGKHKLLQSISPNKTIEGALGGIIGSICTAYIFSLYYTRISLTHFLILGFICSISAQIGDLVESAFKRKKGIKDSKMFINPFQVFGGFLDRCDSVFFSIPVSYCYMYYFNLL